MGLWRMASPGLELWTQAVCLQEAGEAAPTESVVVFGGQDQHEVWPQTGWNVPTSHGRHVLAEQE